MTVTTSSASHVPPLEEHISAREAAEIMGVSISTFKRYYLYGRNGVRLKTLLPKRRTTRKWIEEFFLEVSAADYTCVLPENPDDPGSDESIEAAREYLREAGVLESTPDQEVSR